MKWFPFEQSVLTYWADFVVYGLSVVLLAGFVTFQSPRALWLSATGYAAAGFVVWSLVEYLMHRFVSHSLPPVKPWHGERYRRPGALMATPTWISAGLISLIVFAPLALLASAWIACAFTFGFLSGYLAYTMTHQAPHRWRAIGRWPQDRKRFHARHHLNHTAGGFGVAIRRWDYVDYLDYVFGTTNADKHKDV